MSHFNLLQNKVGLRKWASVVKKLVGWRKSFNCCNYVRWMKDGFRVLSSVNGLQVI